MSTEKIAKLEEKIGNLTAELRQLQRDQAGLEVPNYEFQTTEGSVALLDLFGEHEKMLAIHNMGQGCRYCTLWADGLNGFVPHLESAVSVVLLSKDSPDLQRNLANSRNWRIRMASHGGGKYMEEQVAAEGMSNMPGVAHYERRGNKIYRKGSSYFGPGDLYCSVWHFLGLAGIDLDQWTPQYNYWRRPKNLEDGGENVLDA